MARKLFVFLLVIATAAIAGLLIGNQFPAYGQAGRIAGSYQVSMIPESGSAPAGIDYLATVGSDGTMIVTVPPLNCLNATPYASFSTGHGSWGVVATTAGPHIRFHLRSALYISGRFEGFLQIVGEAPIRLGNEVHGAGHLSFPPAVEACQREFDGASRFKAQAIPPVPPDLR